MGAAGPADRTPKRAAGRARAPPASPL